MKTGPSLLRLVLAGSVVVIAGSCGTTTPEGSSPGSAAVKVRYESIHEGGDAGGVLSCRT